MRREERKRGRINDMYLGMGPGKDRKKGGRKGYPETVMRGLAGTFTTLATLPSASAFPPAGKASLHPWVVVQGLI